VDLGPAVGLAEAEAGPVVGLVEDEGVSHPQHVETAERSLAATATGPGARGTPNGTSNLQHRKKRSVID